MVLDRQLLQVLGNEKKKKKDYFIKTIRRRSRTTKQLYLYRSERTTMADYLLHQ